MKGGGEDMMALFVFFGHALCATARHRRGPARIGGMNPWIRPALAVAAALLLAACSHVPPGTADTGSGSIDEPGGLPPGYQLVWADEFDTGPLPDPARWAYDTHA